jgi:hypothetical protein
MSSISASKRRRCSFRYSYSSFFFSSCETASACHAQRKRVLRQQRHTRDSIRWGRDGIRWTRRWKAFVPEDREYKDTGSNIVIERVESGWRSFEERSTFIWRVAIATAGPLQSYFQQSTKEERAGQKQRQSRGEGDLTYHLKLVVRLLIGRSAQTRGHLRILRKQHGRRQRTDK